MLKKFLNNKWVFTILTGMLTIVGGAILTKIIDKISIGEAIVKVWTTLVKWIQSIFTFKIPVWFILIMFIVICVIRSISKKQIKQDPNDFRNYTKDSWKQWTFAWEYRIDERGDNYILQRTFEPICSCGCLLSERREKRTNRGTMYSARGFLYCPVCKKYYDKPTEEEMEEAFLVIQDKFIKGTYRNEIDNVNQVV